MNELKAFNIKTVQHPIRGVVRGIIEINQCQPGAELKTDRPFVRVTFIQIACGQCGILGKGNM